MHTTLMRISAMVATLAAAALLAVGCGDDSSSSSSEGSGGSTSTEEATPAASTEGDGLALRITLDRLLGEHMILASNATQKALLGSKDVEAALGALEANTTELSGAIGSVYGDDAESAFQEQWAAHNGLFVNYTTAVAKDDAKGKASAVKGLGEYQEEFGAFLAEATGLPAGAVQEQLGIHVTHTAKGVDAFAAKDYATAYQQQRIGFDHMFAVGD
ncbi:MAG: uncharacterized protein JWO69_1090, partial [Thermoleophilia bacterium]|nr:uncharacterized protein [Thermoleophilia bacterium]